MTLFGLEVTDEAGYAHYREEMTPILTRHGGASFLCVIKDCGPEGKGMLSFPMRGISIALDLSVTDDTQALVDALNVQVIREGGRIYLTKDTFTRPEHFRAMEPRLPAFLVAAQSDGDVDDPHVRLTEKSQRQRAGDAFVVRVRRDHQNRSN